MRILVLTIFLTLLNDVRAAPSQDCLDSFSVDMESDSDYLPLAEEICAAFSADATYDCVDEFRGSTGDDGYGPFRFIETTIYENNPNKDLNPWLVLGTEIFQQGWRGDYIEYLTSDGDVHQHLAKVFQSNSGILEKTFSNLNFATYTNNGKAYIVLRYYHSNGSGDLNPTFNYYYVTNCPLQCQDEGQQYNSDGSACECKTSDGFVESPVCYRKITEIGQGSDGNYAHCNGRSDGRQVRMPDTRTSRKCFELCVHNNKERDASDPDYWGDANSFHWHAQSGRCYCNANPCDNSYCAYEYPESHEDWDSLGINHPDCTDLDTSNDPKWYSNYHSSYRAFAISYDNDCLTDTVSQEITEHNGCEQCPDGASVNEAGNRCECNTANNFYLDTENGSCQECPADLSVNTAGDGCGCDVDNNFYQDTETGSCQECPTGAIVNAAGNGCECNTDQKYIPDPDGDGCHQCTDEQVVSSNGLACECNADDNFIPIGDGCHQCAEPSTVNSAGTACECPNDGYFGEGEDCGPCNEEQAELNTVRGTELCYDFNGESRVESIDNIQAIQNSLSQVKQTTGECPLNVE